MQPQAIILMHDKAELPNYARDKQSKCVIKRKRVKYSGTPLIRPPTGHGNLAVLTGGPYQRGWVKFHDWYLFALLHTQCVI